MTLIIGASKPEGIYLSVDYRVSDGRGVVVDDGSSKCLTVHYPPPPSGLVALFGFTGIALLPDGTPTLKWLRETLRGEAETPDASMAHLRERLDRDFGHLRQPLIVNVLALNRADNRRFCGGFSNIRKGATTPRSSFGYAMDVVDTSFLFVNGSGATVAVADDKLKKAIALLGVTPRKVQEFMKLLALVNRRVAARDTRVSPFCHVHFLGATAEHPPQSQIFAEARETVPFEMPVILFGIDMTDMAARLVQSLKQQKLTGEFGPPLFTSDEANEQVRRRD